MLAKTHRRRRRCRRCCCVVRDGRLKETFYRKLLQRRERVVSFIGGFIFRGGSEALPHVAVCRRREGKGLVYELDKEREGSDTFLCRADGRVDVELCQEAKERRSGEDRKKKKTKRE